MALDDPFSKDATTRPPLEGEPSSMRGKGLFEQAMEGKGIPNPLDDSNLGVIALHDFDAIDSDTSGTLSKSELKTASEDSSDQERQQVARILLDNFDEAKKMATETTPFAVSKWSLNFASSNYYEPRFSNDFKPDISRKDVEVLAHLESYRFSRGRILNEQRELGVYSGALSSIGFFSLNLLPAAPAPVKALIIATSGLLLGTSVRALFDGTNHVDDEINKRNNQVRGWLEREGLELHSETTSKQR